MIILAERSEEVVYVEVLFVGTTVRDSRYSLKK